MEAKTSFYDKKIKKQAFIINVYKRANLANKIFNYIYKAKCCWFFSLAWYNDFTYGNKTNKNLLLKSCWNSSGCMLKDPKFLKRQLFINIATVKYLEADKKWIVCKFALLIKWQKAKLKAIRSQNGLDNMPKSLLMSFKSISFLFG